MKSHALGKNILAAEVTHISINGIWVYVDDKEYFLSFDEYPWFREAPIKKVQNVEFLNSCHLFWPDLDIDLELESLDHPEKYPLIYKT